MVSMVEPGYRGIVTPGWVRDPLWQRAQRVPSLDLRFAANRSLRDAVTGCELVTFTRASSATVVGPTGLIETVANDVPRFQHDPVTGQCLGLLVEEQRANLLLNSATLSTQSVTSAATAYTLSFYGTGTITLSGTSTAGPLVGTASNQRVSLTFTPTAGTLTLTVSGSVTNANLEAGSFATSWIPTTGSSATRSADIATITGAAFSGWYDQAQGTFFIEGIMAPGLSRFPTDLSIHDGTSTNSIQSYNYSGTFAASIRKSGEAGTDPSVSGSPASGSLYRKAVAIQPGNYRVAANGVDGAGLNPAFVPTVDRLIIGATPVNSQIANSTISRIVYWPQRLSNATLQALTR